MEQFAANQGRMTPRVLGAPVGEHVQVDPVWRARPTRHELVVDSEASEHESELDEEMEEELFTQNVCPFCFPPPLDLSFSDSD